MSLSPRQERVAHRLSAQIGPGPAAFFRDVCTLVAERPTHASVTHLVAHLMREVESALVWVLGPVSADTKSDRHRAKIRAVLDDLAISHEDAVAGFWLGLAGEGNAQGLAARAHRSALDAPRPFNADFLDFVDKMEQVLDAVLERFETNYFEVFERLDELLATANPTEAHADTFRQRFPRSPAVSHYFFSRASAAWVKPLHRAGLFASPPPAQIDDDSGTVQLPPWPESQYLARVAAEAPESVVEAALATPYTDNGRVSLDLVEIAIAVPPGDGVRLVPKVVEALGSRFGVLIPQRVGSLLVHLCGEGNVDQAMTLADALFRRLPTMHGPSASVDAYEYGEILREHVPALVAAAGIPALTLLSGVLAEVTRADAEQRHWRPGQDGSPVWRPAIEGYENRAESDLRHALINAVRDAAIAMAESDPSGVADVVAELESHDWLIFRRLSFYLLAQQPGWGRDLVAARLTDSATITDWGLEREYLVLARTGAAGLDAAHLRRLLTLIEAGPQPSVERVASPARVEPDVSRPVTPERVAWWQRDRLAAVRDVLPPQWDARYQALVAEHGEAPDPSAPVPDPFWSPWSGEGPVTAGELTAMPTDALVRFLRTWKPPATDGRPLSPASLCGALTAAVTDDATRRSADAASFIGLPAVYVDAVIDGLCQASARGAHLQWDGVVQLSGWINQQARDEVPADAADPAVPARREWRESRMDMLRLLMSGLNPEPSPISPDHDEDVWSIVASCCDDPDPTPARETNHTPEEDGAFMLLASDAVRPQAVRAAIAYGLRLHRRSPSADLSHVLALLEQHLDPLRDPSRAVRSIYGELFPNLAWMDAEWASEHVEAIFPANPAQQPLLDAAWDGYLGGGRLTDVAWELLTATYATMVERMDPGEEDRPEDFRASHLGRHLINRLWHGQLSLDSHNGILRRFYAKASPELAMQISRAIGIALKDEETPGPVVLARLTTLWESRVAAVRNGSDGRELAEFGRWFAAGHFDPAWSLGQLLTTLSLAGNIETSAAVLSKAADLAAAYTQPCLAILERWVSTAPHPWRLTQSLDSVRRILAIGMAGNPTAVETSKKVLSLLARDHGIDLRDVLPPETSA